MYKLQWFICILVLFQNKLSNCTASLQLTERPNVCLGGARVPRYPIAVGAYIRIETIPDSRACVLCDVRAICITTLCVAANAAVTQQAYAYSLLSFCVIVANH